MVTRPRGSVAIPHQPILYGAVRIPNTIAPAESKAESVQAALSAAIDDELHLGVELRHALHAAPELSHHEHETARAIASALPVPARSAAGSGLIGLIGSGREAPIAVRAELDALPMTEQTSAAWRSRTDAMHACGHDVHAAALVMLTRAAARLASDLPRPLLAVFQPSEEAYPSGAEALVRSEAIAGAHAAVAAHVHPELPWNAVALDPGPVNASSDTVEVVITGMPAHGGYPHRGRDPVLALADTVSTLHASMGRRLDPLAGAVLTVGMMSAGDAENIIPHEARARLTLRALAPGARLLLRTLVEEVVSGVAQAHGCTASIEVTEGAPVLENDNKLVMSANEYLTSFGLGRAPTWRSCGADDFSFFGQVTRIAMAFVGLDGAPGFDIRPLHHPEFLPPDAAILNVARTQAALYFGSAI